MRFLLTCLIIIGPVLSSFAANTDEDIKSKLSQARYISNHLKEHRRALGLYEKIISSLENTGRDSLTLAVQRERITLLLRTGEKTDLLQSLNNGIQIAKRLNDHASLTSLMILKGYMYARLGFAMDATETLDESEQIAKKIKDPDEKNLYLGYLTSSRAIVTNSAADRSLYLSKSYNYYMQVRKESGLYQNAQISGNTNMAHSLMELGLLDSAAHHISIAINHLDPDIFYPDAFYAYVAASSLHEAKNDFAGSEKWLLQALKQAETDSNKLRQLDLYYLLYKNQLAQEKREEAGSYLAKRAEVAAWNDLTRINNIRYVEEELLQRKLTVIDQASKKETFYISTLGSIIMLLTLSMGRMYYQRRDEKTAPGALASDTEAVWLDKPTSAPVPQVTPEDISQLSELFKQDDPSFMIKFNDCFPHFSENLNNLASQALNYAELEICAFTKLNFTTKDIALYRKFTVRSVENRKYRIRKKLMLGPDVDFVVWMTSIR